MDVSSSHPFLTYNHHEQRCDLAKGSTKGLLERRKKISFLPFFNLSLSYALPTFPFFIFFCTLICERVNYRMNNVQYSKLNLIAFSLPYKKRKSQACIWWIEEKSYPNLEEFWLALIWGFCLHKKEVYASIFQHFDKKGVCKIWEFEVIRQQVTHCQTYLTWRRDRTLWMAWTQRLE